MEIRDYFKIFKKYLTLFAVIIILGGASAYFWTKSQPKTFLASTTVTVNKASALAQQDVNYYLYDNYYNVQSAALFSQIVVSWFTSPAFVTEIYEKAGLAVPQIAQNKLGKIFRAVRQEPSTINLSVASANKDEVAKLITAATDVLQEETNKLSKNSDALYEIAKFKPVVSDNAPNIVLNTLIGLFAGLVISIFLCLGLEYFKEGKRENRS